MKDIYLSSFSTSIPNNHPIPTFIQQKIGKLSVNMFLFYCRICSVKQIYQSRQYPTLINNRSSNIMARTKQTARKCLVQAIPRVMLQSQRVARKTGPIKKAKKSQRIKGRNGHVDKSSQSQSQIEINEVNNQQFSVKFDDQAKCQDQAVDGKIIISCTNCEAILTSSSKVYTKTEYKKLSQDPSFTDEKKQKFLKNYDSAWICEFCLTHNSVPKSYTVPKVENPCFLIEQASEKKAIRGQKKQVQQTNKVLIFCIDVSGSMELQVHKKKSRLDTVKEALIDQINRMNFEKEVIKVGLVTFGSLVSLIGDGKTFKQFNLDSAIYHDFDKIVQEASKVNKFAQLIGKSHKNLKTRIENLGVYGSTALGPGLLASIEIASKGGIGSKVIICTDGEANVGVGSAMMGFFSQNSQKKQENFYQKAAEFAKNKRVQVSILSLKGDKCNLKQLGKLSLATGGSILKIDPTALGTQFSKIAKQEILGTDTQLVIKVNKIFEIISHVPNELSADKTTLTQQFGNFSEQTELTFEFKVLSKEEAALKPGVDMELFNQTQLPMQVQLTYVGRNGNKYKQVITDWRVPTQNEKQLNEGANFGLFAASVLQKASAKIKSHEFDAADKIIKGYWSQVEQNFSKTESQAELKKFGDRIKRLKTVLDSQNRKISGNKRERSRSRDHKKSNKKGKQVAKQRKKKLSNHSQSQSQSSDSQQSGGMSSDEQQEILYKEMRARSRSNSPAQKPSKKNRK